MTTRIRLLELGSLGWLAIVAAASLAAGAIHATAIGAHSEHRQAALIFTLTAVVQLAVGVSALMRPGPGLLTLGAMANVGAILGWILAKTVGLPFEGLDAAEPLQRADTLAAILAAVAALAVVAHLRTFGTSRTDPSSAGRPAIVAIARGGAVGAGHAGDRAVIRTPAPTAHAHAWPSRTTRHCRSISAVRRA